MAEQKRPQGRPKGSRDSKPRDPSASKQNLVKARENSPIMQGQTAEIPEEYNARRIRFMQAILPTEPLDIIDIAEMERRFAHYLEMCAEWGMKVGNQAAYAAIGIDKNTAWDWANKVVGNPARSTFIKKVQQICALYREGLMEDGKVNPVTGIFWQKNYDGLKDQQEVVLTPNTDPLGERGDAESLRQKYLENTYGVAELPEGEAVEPQEGAESENFSAERAQKDPASED